MKHPIQPLVKVGGVLRFKENAIVQHLVDLVGLNAIERLDVSDDDRQQLAQLIGYSLSGYGELNYVSDEACQAAEAMERSEPVIEKYQYFYRNIGCAANENTDDNCICWYEEGTGPYSGVQAGHSVSLEWRIKPATVETADK